MEKFIYAGHTVQFNDFINLLTGHSLKVGSGFLTLHFLWHNLSAAEQIWVTTSQ